MVPSTKPDSDETEDQKNIIKGRPKTAPVCVFVNRAIQYGAYGK